MELDALVFMIRLASRLSISCTIALEHFERRQLYHTRRAIAGMRLERCTPRSLSSARSLPEDSRA